MAVTATFVPVKTVAVLAPRGGREDIARQLGTSGTVEWHERSDALVERVSSKGLDAVIVELEDESGRSIAGTVAELAARRPALPVIVYDRIDGATLRSLLAVLGIGLRMECVVRPHERLDVVLQRVVSPDYRPGVAPLLLLRFVPQAPKALRLFVALAALAAAERRGVDEVSGWSGVTPRTIGRRLMRARWPAAHVVLQSFIALDAVWLMSEYGWSARRVQVVRRFPHASSVTRLLARYAGVRPATLREDGGFPAALEHVLCVLSPRDPPIGSA